MMYSKITLGGGGVYKLEFQHFKFCTKILYATCSVFFKDLCR